MFKKITFSILLVFAVITASYQAYIEIYISESNLKSYGVENKERSRFLSFFIFYEMRRMLDVDFQKKEILYVSCVYNEFNFENWESRTDYYLMHLYYSDSEKDSIRSQCKIPMPK